MMDLDTILTPTILLNSALAKKHIVEMAEKAASQHIRFRPHFKTHQSAQIGEWFREAGVTSITCSSFRMAEYFSKAGWKDILVAFPVNVREIQRIRQLAETIHLELLIDTPAALPFLTGRFSHSQDIWIKIDTGAGRAGLTLGQKGELLSLCRRIKEVDHLRLRGLLSHAGQTYHTQSAQTVRQMYAASLDGLNALRDYLIKHEINDLELSVGDTPGCTLTDSLGKVDEIRPGNFIFYDCHQVSTGSCKVEDIAIALACPIVSIHPEKEKVITYGGVVHLSSERTTLDGQIIFGLPALLTSKGWSSPVPGGYVSGLSQEHGILHIPRCICETLKVGDLLAILPVHACITVSCLKQYQTLDGSILTAMNDFIS